MIVSKMISKTISPLKILICVFTFTWYDCKPLPIKLDIHTMSYDLKEKVQEAWCSNRKMARQGKCDIDGFSKQFCFGLDMIRHFKLKFGTLLLNSYDAEKLGEMLLVMSCSDYDVTGIVDSVPVNNHNVDSFEFSQTPITLQSSVYSVDNLSKVSDTTSTEYIRVNKINRIHKDQSYERSEDLNNSRDENYENTYDIWIIPATSIFLVYVFIILYLAYHRKKTLGYFCCKVSKLDAKDSSSGHPEKKE